jgi:hypothetical protein
MQPSVTGAIAPLEAVLADGNFLESLPSSPPASPLPDMWAVHGQPPRISALCACPSTSQVASEGCFADARVWLVPRRVLTRESG